jgi:hypothetical protein
VLFAMGGSDGLSYHGSNKVAASINFFTGESRTVRSPHFACALLHLLRLLLPHFLRPSSLVRRLPSWIIRRMTGSLPTV